MRWINAFMWMALFGSVVMADSTLAPEELLRRAEGGDLQAAFLLGSRFAQRGGSEDAEAVRWYRIAAEGGLAEGQYNLGTLYAQGRGVQRDDTQAAKWFELAAHQGLAPAQFNLASFYASGRGVARDNALAAVWFEQAAKAGLPQAQHNLGLMYEHGQGVALDRDRALQWYQAALAQGFLPAKQRIDQLRHQPGVRTRASAEDTQHNDSLAAQDPNAFTVQLASFHTHAQALQFIERELDVGPAWVYSVRRNGTLRYAVVFGRFDEFEQAERIRDTLPEKILKNRPWVRRMRSVQTETTP